MIRKNLAVLLAVISAAVFMMAGCGEDSAQTETADVAVEETAETDDVSETEAVEQTENEPADSEVDFSRTLGYWRVDGEPDTASIFMDGEGGFRAYFASGALEAEGYLEWVDEYDDGNGRYDMIDFSGEFVAGFYFDSDTQFHIGNAEGTVYIRDDSDLDTAPSVGALTNVPGYTGLTSLEVNNDYYGGYYYKDMTEDLVTVIVNTAFEDSLQEGESLEDMIVRDLTMVEPFEAREVVVTASEEQSARFTYPVYYVTWLTGENEDTVDWTAMAVLTEGYTYIYAYGTYADYAEEMRETWYESFESIELFFP